MVKFTGLVDFVTLAAYLIIFGFFWRVASARLSDKPIGQAMAFIF
jgi:hypothetical protein